MNMSVQNGSSGGRAAASMLSPLNVWGLSLGCAVGWGAFMVPANLYIPTAGPLGTVLAMALSTVLLLVIAYNFCRLAEKFPDDGGIVAYTKNILGSDHAFLAAWILLIAYLSILWANATATVLLARFLLGNVFEWGYLYTLANFDIYFGEIAVTWAVFILFGLFSCYGGILKKHLNTFLAVIFLLTVVLLFTALLNETGTAVFTPLFQSYTSPVAQVLSMCMLAPWMFFGFEAVTHACNDFAFPAKKLFPIVIAAVLSGGLIYILLASMSVMAIPTDFTSWTSYMSNRSGLEGLAGLPVFHSVYTVFGMKGLAVLCLSITAAIATSLLGLFRSIAYLLQYMGKCDILPPWFTRQADDETPRNAIIFVMLISLLIPFLGRVSIVWLCDVITVVGSVAYGYASLCAYFTAREEGLAGAKKLAILGVAISVIFFFCPLLPGLLLNGSLEVESYLMLAVWSLLGFTYYWYTFKTDKQNRFGHSTSMCIMILFLNFFSSSIWLWLVMKQHIIAAANDPAHTSYSSLTTDSLVQMVMILIVLMLMADIFITIKRQERKMTEIRRRQNEIDLARNTFLSNISHDLNIPMEAAQASIHQSLENCSICAACPEENCPRRIPDRLNNYLWQLDAHTQQLTALIRNMIDKKFITTEDVEKGRTAVNRLFADTEPTDWRSLLQNAKDLFAMQMQEKNIFFDAYPIELHHPHVIVDKQRLERLLINLISNACEFTPTGGGVMVTLLETSSTAESATYELHVNDTGANMPPVIIEHMAEPFDDEATDLGGLCISKGLVMLMGGTLKISTMPGQGAGKDIIVTLTLPLAPEPAADHTPIPPEPLAE